MLCELWKAATHTNVIAGILVHTEQNLRAKLWSFRWETDKGDKRWTLSCVFKPYAHSIYVCAFLFWIERICAQAIRTRKFAQVSTKLYAQQWCYELKFIIYFILYAANKKRHSALQDASTMVWALLDAISNITFQTTWKKLIFKYTRLHLFRLYRHRLLWKHHKFPIFKYREYPRLCSTITNIQLHLLFYNYGKRFSSLNSLIKFNRGWSSCTFWKHYVEHWRRYLIMNEFSRRIIPFLLHEAQKSHVVIYSMWQSAPSLLYRLLSLCTLWHKIR